MNLKNNGECDIIGNTQPKNALPLSNDIINVKEKISGIYKIINKVNGKYYVGSANNITGIGGRWNIHINSLRKNTHHNIYLQRAWNKHGENAFEFVIVELVDLIKLRIVEQTYLDNRDIDKCYNINPNATGGGLTGECKLKMIASLKLYYKNNPKISKLQTLGCHTPLGTSHRTSSLNKYWKNNERAREIARKRTNNYFKSKEVRTHHGIQFRSPIIHRFQNKILNVIFVGTQYDFRMKYNLSRGVSSGLVTGRIKVSNGWTIIK